MSTGSSGTQSVVSGAKKSIKPPIPRQSASSSSKVNNPPSFNINPVPLLPYIQDIDLLEELIVVANPSSSARDLSGWRVSDDHGRNKFVFPPGTSVSGRGVLNLYCCAKGKMKGDGEGEGEGHGGLKTPFIFWTNKDGSPRMKNVLNDGTCYNKSYS